jgi:hypothetical protein
VADTLPAISADLADWLYETIAQARDNGRVTLMFCAFRGLVS